MNIQITFSPQAEVKMVDQDTELKKDLRQAKDEILKSIETITSYYRLKEEPIAYAKNAIDLINKHI